jgi:succinate dehydrogenase/fumarate reductase-like Fe-S protein
MTPGSFVRLGYYFAKRLLLRLVRREDGLARFRANYVEPERLLPVGSKDREAVQALSRCIACGLCDAHFSAYREVDRARFRAPSDLPLSHTRSLPDYDALDAYLGELRKGDLRRLEKVCPVGVPFEHLAAFVERKANEMNRSDGT